MIAWAIKFRPVNSVGGRNVLGRSLPFAVGDVRRGEVHSRCKAVGVRLGARSKEKEKAVSAASRIQEGEGIRKVHKYNLWVNMSSKHCHHSMPHCCSIAWTVFWSYSGRTKTRPALKCFWILAHMTYLAMNHCRTECFNLLESVCEERLLEVMSWSLQGMRSSECGWTKVEWISWRTYIMYLSFASLFKTW
jgi:hypothetical protein